MNPTIRAYRFWHIFTFFHNFLLKKQLLWRNRGDIHTFVSDAVYCRSAGKLTLYVSNVDILMKKKKSQPPKYFSWERKYFFVEILTCGLMGVTGQCFRLPISTTGQNICPDYIFHEGSRFLLLVILVMPLGILMVMKNHKAWAYQAVRTGQMRLGAWSSWVILSVQCQSSMVLRHLKKKVLAKC